MSQTGGTIQWTVLEGGAGQFNTAVGGETTSFTLTRPSLLRDEVGVEIGVVYSTPTKTASNRTVIYLDEINFTLPYIKGWSFNVVGKPPDALPVPGDVVQLSMTHAIPQGGILIDEQIITDPPVLTVPPGPDFDVHVQAMFIADYLLPNIEPTITDMFERSFLLPFSQDLDGNGNPDLVDADFLAFDAMLQAESDDNPDPADPVRLFRIAGARLPAVAAPGATPEKYNKNLEDAYGVTSCNPNTWACTIELGPLTRMPNDIDWLVVTKIHELRHVAIYQLKHLGLIPCFLAEWWQDETKTHDGDFVEKGAKFIAWALFNVHFDPKAELAPNPAIPPGILKLDDNPFLLTPPLRPTFNIPYGAETIIDLTIVNTHPTLSLDNINLTPALIETSLGEFIPSEMLGGVITGGPNGVADTQADPVTDVQITPVGEATPMSHAIDPGPNGMLESVPSGDDVVSTDENRILSGLNGVVESSASGDDVQVMPVGGGSLGTIAVGPGADGVLDTIPTGDDQIELATSSAIIASFEVLSAPTSIGPNATGVATLRVITNPLPPGLGQTAEFALLTAELTAQLGGGPMSLDYPLQLFLPAQAPPCADINGDGVVDGADLAFLLTNWGVNAGPADFNGDGVVNGADLAQLLANWGPCP